MTAGTLEPRIYTKSRLL